MRTRIFESTAAMAKILATELLTGLIAARAAGRSFLLAVPAGRSAKPICREVVRAVTQQRVALSHLVLLVLDSYVLSSADGLRYPPAAAHFSTERFLVDHLLLPIGQHVDIWWPDLAEPAAFDTRIEHAGGIDLAILASGSGDGHVAFNSWGSERTTKTRIVELPISTRRDNLRTYPDFETMAEVPTRGVTMGIATIADLAHRAILILPGREKRLTFQHISRCAEYDSSWPASVITSCRDAEVWADVEAAHGDRK